METLNGCYLLLGEDSWSKHQFIQKVKESVLTDPEDMMNYYEAKDRAVEVSKIEDAVQTLPFFADKKIIYLKDTGLFKAGKKDESERFEALLKKLPEYIVMLIDEKEVDKRGKLYKLVQKDHQVKNFDYMGEEAAYAYFREEADKLGLKVEPSILRYFVQHMPEDMNAMRIEWNKLVSYVENNTITKEAIDTVCVFSLETRVFEMVKMIMRKQADEALKIYERLMQSKESPLGVLVLVARQYRMMLQVKYLGAKRKSAKEIATQVKLPYFAAKDMLDQTARYSFEALEQAVAACLDTDRMIKSGRMEPTKAVELLIIEGLI